MRSIVVLGSGTGVGKTRVSVALAEALRRADPNAAVLALKPIETGVTVRAGVSSPPSGSDAAALERVSNAPPIRPHPLYAFAEPVSPHLAARKEKRRIEVPRILTWLAKARALQPYTTLPTNMWLLVETAGGVFSPLSSRLSNVDLALACGPAAWILVAPDSLGVLHDIRAVYAGLAATHRVPDYVVLTGARHPDASTGTNAAELPRIGLPRPIATIARDAPDPAAALAPLATALSRSHAHTPIRLGRRARAPA
jgi:dethiobiotin synthetase